MKTPREQLRRCVLILRIIFTLISLIALAGASVSQSITPVPTSLPAAQERLLPNQTVAKSIESAKTQTYSISLNDGDYVSGSINQHGKVNVSILSTDGSLLRRVPGPSADAKRQFAFAAERGRVVFDRHRKPWRPACQIRVAYREDIVR